MTQYKHDELKNHDYDGIQEYDNQLPRWWLGTFFLTLAFALTYWFYFHITQKGATQAYEFDQDLKAHQEKFKAANNNENPFDQEALNALLSQSDIMDNAKNIFNANCAACHGMQAQGLIGPNLTDNAWIHGGTPQEIYHTIEVGVAAKGMPKWHGILSSDNIRHLSAYIISLGGTNPPNAKAPEGNIIP